MARPYRDSAAIAIAAPPLAVWEMVADVTRMGEWSPVCRRCEWIAPATGPAVGARFTGYSRMAGLRWSRECEVLTAEPGLEFAFQTTVRGRPSTFWRYRFARNATGGTDLTEEYTVAADSAAPLWVELVESLPGMHRRNRAAMRAGMIQTLRGLKAEAETRTAPHGPQPHGGERT